MAANAIASNVEVDATTEQMIDRLQSSFGEIVSKAVFEYAGRQAEPLVRGFIAENIQASGIQSRSGRLMDSAMSATVRVYLDKRGLQMVVRLAPQPAKQRGGRQDEFYKYAAVQHYGSAKAKVPTRDFMRLTSLQQQRVESVVSQAINQRITEILGAA